MSITHTMFLRFFWDVLHLWRFPYILLTSSSTRSLDFGHSLTASRPGGIVNAGKSKRHILPAELDVVTRPGTKSILEKCVISFWAIRNLYELVAWKGEFPIQLLFQTNKPTNINNIKFTYPQDGNLHLYWCFIFQPATDLSLPACTASACYVECYVLAQLGVTVTSSSLGICQPSHHKGSIQLEVANTIWWRLIFGIQRFQCQVSWGRFIVDDFNNASYVAQRIPTNHLT